MPYLTTKDGIDHDSAMIHAHSARSLHPPTGVSACVACSSKSKKPKLI